MEELLLDIGLDKGITFLIAIVVIFLAFKLGEVKINEIKLRSQIDYEMTSPITITDHLKHRVWMASKDKLEFIRNTLRVNHIQGREDEVWLKVMNYLGSKTDIYIDEFSSFNTPYGDLGEMYVECFKMEEFAEDVKTKFFSILNSDYENLSEDTRILKVYLITEDIANIMMKYQLMASTKLLAKLKVTSNHLNDK